jgi:hypothetical protein
MESIHSERRVCKFGLKPCKMIQQKFGESGIGDVGVAATVGFSAKTAEDPYFSEAGGQR